MGRFVSADSIIPGQGDTAGTANPQNLNRYAYVNNNPIKNTDPTGHCIGVLAGLDTLACAAVIIGGAILVGGALVAVSSSPNSGMRWGDYDWTNWPIPGLRAETNNDQENTEATNTGADDTSEPQTPLEKAISGGANSGLYKQYKDKSEKEVRKALRSYEQNVEEHEGKLADPNNAGTRTPWDEMDPREQQGLLEKWANDLKRNQEQAEIMQGILKERGIGP